MVLMMCYKHLNYDIVNNYFKMSFKFFKIIIKKSREWGSNPWPTDLQSVALPTELSRGVVFSHKYFFIFFIFLSIFFILNLPLLCRFRSLNLTH